MTRSRRTRESKPAWQCAPRPVGPASPVGPLPVGLVPVGLLPVGLVLVADPAGLRTRLARSYPPEQAAALADAAAADTLGALPYVPDGVVAAGSPADAFADPSRRAEPTLLVRAEFPQLSPAVVADATALLDEFDAVLGLTGGDGWWAFGLREPAHLPLPQSAAALTVAVLRLGLRVAMLPTLRELHTAADVDAIAAHCPADSAFAGAAARYTSSEQTGR